MRRQTPVSAAQKEVRMRTRRVVAVCLVAGVSAGWLPTPSLADHDRVRRLRWGAGEVALEVVGQVVNAAPSESAPLGSSNQFGYVSFLNGAADPIFEPGVQNEGTARITFFTEVTSVQSTTNGPFLIVIREGTTTLYRNVSPASFSAPDSFRSGTPIQTSSIRQQVILDTVERTFTVVNLNTIRSSAPFALDDTRYRLGRAGEMLRTSLMGVLFVRGGTPPPTGHFAGHAVGVGGKEH
jgi:hypothetical protein